MRMSHVSPNKMLHLVCVPWRAAHSPSDWNKKLYFSLVWSFYSLQGNILLHVPRLASVCERKSIRCLPRVKKSSMWECLEIWHYYFKFRWKLGHILTLSATFESIKAHLKSVFFSDRAAWLRVLKGTQITTLLISCRILQYRRSG